MAPLFRVEGVISSVDYSHQAVIFPNVKASSWVGQPPPLRCVALCLVRGRAIRVDSHLQLVISMVMTTDSLHIDEKEGNTAFRDYSISKK